MKTDTRDNIIEYITRHGQARAGVLHETFRISKVAIHKQLNRLLKDGLIVRVGKPPLVFYTLLPDTIATQNIDIKNISTSSQRDIDRTFLSITPDGRLLYGMEGFIYWMQLYQKNKKVEVVANEYSQMVLFQKKLYGKNSWIDATSKLVDTFTESPISKLLFKESYSFRTFGRTMLAKLVMHAKQTGERHLIDEISDTVKPVVEKIIVDFKIEAAAYIPPTVPRPLQFMDELESRLNLRLAKIELVKITPGDIPIAQKTLSGLNERIINARDSIYLKSNTDPAYKNILLIDDVAGSGASFNETAKKIKKSYSTVQSIIAFSLVGNLKGYDIIREI